MPNASERYAKHKFGRATAQPPITEIYSGAGGWRAAEAKEPLSEISARELRADGITMVRVRWHMRTYEIILRRYLGD